MWYDTLNNKNLWKIFNEISSIPRESGNEEGIRSYLVSWAKEHNLDSIVDKVGNVIIKCPATPGYEKREPIALQGHMDMVCVKREGSTHDFKKDPIEVVTDGTVIRAKDTTLGADNGIALALILDIFSDKNAKHGKLEGIFTVSEETGLTGAYGIEPELVESRKLLNLDSEEENVFYIGCAGGIDIVAKRNISWQEPNGEAIEIKVNALKGGHSGGEIHKERANALSIMGRYLTLLKKFNIASLEGGTRRNVIPSTCSAVIVLDNKEEALKKAEELQKELREEYRIADPDITLSVKETAMPERVIKDVCSSRVAKALYATPTGVDSWNMAIEGVVETSCNKATVKLDDESVTIVFSVRSSSESRKLNKAREIEAILKLCGFSVKIGDGYPAWTPNPDSAFTKEVAKAYKKITGKKPVITAIHAGLECGIINQKIPGMDSLSLGPNLFDVHSVNEHVEVDSAERIAAFVKEMLGEIK